MTEIDFAAIKYLFNLMYTSCLIPIVFFLIMLFISKEGDNYISPADEEFISNSISTNPLFKPYNVNAHARK